MRLAHDNQNVLKRDMGCTLRRHIISSDYMPAAIEVELNAKAKKPKMVQSPRAEADMMGALRAVVLAIPLAF